MEPFKRDLVISYNQQARERKKYEPTRDSWKYRVREKFVDLLKREQKKTILELGAGIGTDSRYFMDNGFEVVAIDMSEEMVKVCLEKGVNAIVMDIYNIENLERKFDAVYSMNVMLHVPKSDLDFILKKIKKILNSNGLFYFGSYGGVTEEITINDARTNNSPRFFSKLSDEDLLNVTKIFEKVDFEIVELNASQKDYHYQSLTLRKK